MELQKQKDEGFLDWLLEERIVNEKGDPIEFNTHPFLLDIYDDQSTNLVTMKAAQVGMSTLQILKNHRDAKREKLDVIYTLPTDKDVSVFVGGKVNRIIANNPSMLKDVADKDSIEQKQVENSMIYFRGCVDEKTEVLTENGWCSFNQISVGDKLPTLNIETNRVEVDSVYDITKFKATEEMVRIQSSLVDQLVTKDHRCVVSKRKLNGKKGMLRIVRARELLGKKSSYIPITHNAEHALPDALYKILGWVIGDGSYWTKRNKSTFVRRDGTISKKVYESPRACIIQSKLCSQLESDLADADISYNKKRHNGTCWRYELSANASKKIRQILPQKCLTNSLVWAMTSSERYGLLHGLLMSDGDNYKRSSFWQNKNGTCDALQSLLVLSGKTSNLSTRNGTRKQRVRIKSNLWTNPRITLEQYSGIVWCPTTRNGTVFIRRNGKVSVTGQTWTKKSATMVTADRVVHDEKDSSKLDIIADYQARLQHSKFKQTHTFSHPSLPETGIHADWLQSDQKHWFVTCPSCKFDQFLNWDLNNPNKMSIDIERKCFVCKKCKAVLDDKVRALGFWKAKYPEKSKSGYWVPLLICPWISAEFIIDKFKNPDTTSEFFYTKILGLPYADASAKLLRQSFFQNLTGSSWAPHTDERVIIGIDTGLRLDYVMGSKNGLFFHGDCNDYGQLDLLMKRWGNAIAVIDQGGDLIGSRAFFARWQGRVVLGSFVGDRKTKELAQWGTGDEAGHVKFDRNRSIQLVVDEFRTKRIPVHGTEADWFEYWLDWNHLAKMKVLDPETNEVKGYKWIRSGRDHRAMATVLWRVGMMRFAGMGEIINPPEEIKPRSYMINPNQTVEFDPKEMFDIMESEKEEDWRSV